MSCNGPIPRGLIAVGLGVVVGFVAALLFRPAPEPAGERRVVLEDAALWASLPRAPRSLGEQITTRTVQPVQVATSRGTPDRGAVRRYCAPIADSTAEPLHTSARPRVAAPDSAPRPAPLLPPFAGRVTPRALELHATRADGSLWRARYPIHGRAAWTAGHGGASDTLAQVVVPRRLLGVLALDPALFAEGEYLPLDRRVLGRAGVALGDESLRLRVGVTQRAEPFVGAALAR